MCVINLMQKLVTRAALVLAAALLVFRPVVAAPATPVNFGSASGSSIVAENGYDITATGADIGGTSDSFHFEYEERNGNFDVKVRLKNLSAFDMWTKAGLMARDALTSGARFAGAFATPSTVGAQGIGRSSSGGNATSGGYAPVNYPNSWLRLARTGNDFVSYASVDGQTWVRLNSITLASAPARMYVGLAVASRSLTDQVAARFRDYGGASGGTIVQSYERPGEPLAASSRRTGLVISEIMYHPKDRPDQADLEFIELFNSDSIPENLSGMRLAGAVNYTFPAGTVLRSGALLVVARNPAAMRAVYGIDNVIGPYEGNLSNDSGVVELHSEFNAMILEAHYSDNIGWPLAADGAGHSLVLARPSWGETQREAWAKSAFKGGSPGMMEPIVADPYENLVINEILAHTDDPQKDFIEIYNHSNAEVNLAGCFLTDNRDHTNRYTFADNVSIPARGFLAVDQDALGFALSAAGETVYLVASNDVRVIDAVRFEGQANGVSFGRYPDGDSRLRALRTVTQGAANDLPLIPSVVINEIMYHPISDNDDEEYVELFNQGTTAVDLSGWRFADGISLTFPAGAVIAPGGYVVVGRNVATLRAKYPQLNSTNLFGDYDGSLSNSGERIALYRPDEIQSTNEFGAVTTEVIYIVASEVEYREGGRWGKWADGGGSSLELIDPRGDPNQPSSWTDSNEESKGQWTTIEFTGVLDNGGISEPNQFQMFLQGGGECLVDEVELRRSGGTNIIANGNFENNLTGWVLQGAFRNSVVEIGTGWGSTRCLRVTSPVRGDTGANRIRYNLPAGSLASGNTATLRARVRWLKGFPEFMLRVRGNWIEAAGAMSLPNNLGTPGQVNSRYKANIGPAIYDVGHAPILPANGQPVVVSARLIDPDRFNAPTLKYRIENTNTFSTIEMNDNGLGGDAVAGDGVWSASIPGQTSRLGAFYVEAYDQNRATATNTFPAEAPAKECLVRWGETQAPGTFATYRLWMSQATINAWRSREVLNNAPLDVTFVYGNHRVIYNVGSLYSGSPFHAGYDSPVGGICDYIVNFRDDEVFLGATDFVLASVGNLDNDDSAQREQAAFWIARKLGTPYNNRRYVHMFVNGARRGKIFEDAQQPNSHFVQGWFPRAPDGDLMKIEDWFEFNDSAGMLGNVDANLGLYTTTGGALKTARYRWCWRPRAVKKSANDFTEFFELVRAANDNTPNYTTRVDNNVDVENWMRVICLEHLAGNWDSYGYGRGKNMFTYRPGNGKWTLMPWDIDFVLGSGSDGPDTDMFGGVNDGSVARMLNTPQFRRAYFRAMQDAANGPLAPENIGPILDARSYALTANGVGIPSNSPIKDYISARRSQLQRLVESVASNFAITSNNGNNFSTNRNFVTIAGTAPIAVKTIEVNGAPYPVTWTDVTTWSIAVPLTAASNDLQLRGYDLRGAPVPGSADSITITYTGALGSPAGNVVINEIMYNPLAPDASFIELANISPVFGFDLTGYQLDGVGFTFPEGSVIAPSGFMVIAKSAAAFSIAYGGSIPIRGEFPGSLDNGGERLKLVKPGSPTVPEEVIDVVRYDDDPPWPIAADGGGPSLQLVDPTRDNSRVANWAVNTGATKFTPGAANNVRANLSAFPDLWINEILPNNTDGITDGAGEKEPWIELYNSGASAIPLSDYFLTDSYGDLQKWRFPAGSSINPGQYLLIWADGEPAESVEGALHTNFRMQPTNGVVALVRVQNTTPAVIDYINYKVTSPNRSFGSYPDGQNQDRQVFHFPSPRLANDNRSIVVPITINEWLASNTRTLADPADRQFEDWFELYNSSDEAVDLSGFYLTDLLTNTTKFRIPPGYIVPANGYLLVWADEETGQNVSTNIDLHADFRLGASGEEIGLFGADGVKIDSITFGQQTDDVSQGRYPDGGAAPFQTMTTPTPRAPNNIPSGNKPPVLAGVNNALIPEDSEYRFQATASDPDAGQTVTYSLAGGPPGASVDPATGVFTWTPGENDGPGNFTMTFRATDNGTPALTRSVQFTLTVLESNRAPVIGELPNVEIPEGALFSFVVPVTDPDVPGQPLFYSLDQGPEGASVHASSGRFDWTPAELQGPGVFPVIVRVTDAGDPALSHTRQFVITVLDVNAPPNLAAIPDQLVIEGDTLVVNPVATDGDVPAQSLAFSMEGPATAQIDPVTGRFTWTPSGAEIPGTNSVTIRVTDSGTPAQTSSQSFVVVTAKSNHPPAFTSLPEQSANEEVEFTLTLQAEDVDLGQTLSYAIEGSAPAGLSLSNSGQLRWTPSEIQGPSTNEVSFRVTDDGLPPRSVVASVTIVVNEINKAPSLADIPPQSAKAGVEFVVTAGATDSDRPANSITYSLEAAPPGATINPSSGRIAWTPGAQHANTTQTFTVRATDNGSPARSDSRTFSVVVQPLVTWKFVSATGTASSSAIYLYLEAAGSVFVDDMQLVAGDVAATGPNLLPNGDFEDPLSGPWTVSPNHAESVIVNSPTKSGNAALKLVASSGGTTRASSVFQDITPALQQGATYTLSFWFVPTSTDIQLVARLSGSGINLRTSIFGQDPPPVILLSATATATGEFKMQWPARSGLRYRVWYRSDVETGVWQTLQDITAAGPAADFTTVANTQARFYRVELLP